MKHDIVDNVKHGGPYKHKTIMFCWEHQAIPYIAAKFGLVSKDQVPNLHWGADPFARVGCFGLIAG